MFTNFTRIAFSEGCLQILKIVLSVKLRRKHASCWAWTTRLYLQSKFSPFCNRKFPSISHAFGLNVKIRNFNNTVFMRKNIPENVIRALIYD